jgi:hypothetical protein
MEPALTKSGNTSADVSLGLKEDIARKRLLSVMVLENQIHVKTVEHVRITSRIILVTVYLVSLDKTVQQMWMIVQIICVKTVELVETALTNIPVNVRQSSQESSVRLNRWLLIYTHRPPLASSTTASMVYVWTSRALMTISASVLLDTPAKDVNTLPVSAFCTMCLMWSWSL